MGEGTGEGRKGTGKENNNKKSTATREAGSHWLFIYFYFFISCLWLIDSDLTEGVRSEPLCPAASPRPFPARQV